MPLAPEDEARLRALENSVFANNQTIMRLERDLYALEDIPERLARIDEKLDHLGKNGINWQSWLLAATGWLVAILGWTLRGLN